MQTQTQSPVNEQWGYRFFEMVDRKDDDEYSKHFVEDGQVIFANDAPIRGKEAIRQGLAQFYNGLQSMHHEIERLWVPEANTVVSRATAHYVLQDGRPVDVPVVTIINVADGTEQVRKVQFYMDMTPLRNG